MRGRSSTNSHHALDYQGIFSFFENFDESIFVIDPDTYEILYVNQIVKKLLGNVINQKCHKVFQGNDSPCSFCINRQIFGENLGKSHASEFYNEHLGRYFKCNSRAIRWPSGKMVRCEVAIDITEQKQSEERYRDLVEKARVAILIDDREGNLKYANAWCAKIFGYSLEEMKSQSIRTVVHRDDVDRVMKYHLDRLNGKSVPSRYDFKGIKKDDSSIFLEVDATIFIEKGQAVGTRSYIWDVTDRKRAEEEARETLIKLRKSLNSTINVIALTVEARDNFLFGHQRRVADLARAIATEMRIPKDKIDGIRSAGVIHDLGKISIPAEILSKPGKLNEAEFNLIKSHPRVSYDILKNIEFPWPVAEIVYQHHERMNGSGYPRGLTGDNILIEARIISVADVIEAMTSHRPYRPGLGIEKALKEIEMNRGTLYDPNAVDACLKLFKEKRFIFKND
jgi:PAS domain S-box-containing protein